MNKKSLYMPNEAYQQRLESYQKDFQKKSEQAKQVSNLRFFVFFLGFAGGIYLFSTGSLIPGLLYSMIFFTSFILLVIKFSRLQNEMEYTKRFIEMNKRSLERLQGEWNTFSDQGEEFKNSEHPYSTDLDIFGESSLFQWVNTTNTYFGRMRLKKLFIQPEKTIREMKGRQEAVGELASLIDWRQRFQAEGWGKIYNPQKLLQWAAEKTTILPHNWFKQLITYLPFVTLGSLLLAFLIPAISYVFPVALIVIQLLLTGWKRKEMHQLFRLTERSKNSIKTYNGLLQLIEEQDFQAPLLQTLQKQLQSQSDLKASGQVRKLQKVVDLMELRFDSVFYFVINTLLLWDYRCLFKLETWKAKAGNKMAGWLETIGQIEALASLAVICHDQPEWTFPHFTRQEKYFSANAMGHPLLADEARVCNDLQMIGPGNILVITGSNMSGKSTLLRTVGINLVLAYAGAPICAESMTTSTFEIYSSMRVNDNLEKRISSFYAELLRVKMIIEAARRGENVLFLLDEIFRGTNSHDRHLGAQTLIKELGNEGALGLVSTHDLELGELAKLKEFQIENYHFQEFYQDDQIKFDYRLHQGVSTTTNALYLMKMIGIRSDLEKNW